VFLVGAARSGTSLLYRVLALHPRASYLSNWNQRFPQHPHLTGLNRLARWSPKRRSVAWFGTSGDNAYVFGRPRQLMERAFPGPAEAETFYRACGIPELGVPLPPATPAAKAALRSAFQSASRSDGHRLVLSKRIANSRRIPLLHEIFPDSRFIEIVRDGRAVALSLSTVDWWESSAVWWYGGTPADWAAAGRDPWELIAQNWVEEVRATRTGLEAVPGSQVLSLSYERLVTDPLHEIRKVVEFLGLDWDDPGWQQALARVRFPDKNERWSRSLDDAVLTRVQAVQAAELRHYGYAA
jgi:hypothetical protein